MQEKSRPDDPHPLFRGFVAAAVRHRRDAGPILEAPDVVVAERNV